MALTRVLNRVNCMQAGSTALKDDKKINANNNVNYNNSGYGSTLALAA